MNIYKESPDSLDVCRHSRNLNAKRLNAHLNPVGFKLRTKTRMEKTPINPKNFTKALGSYSHGMKVELGDANMVFVTGQIAMDSEGKLVSENVEEQTEFVFQNLQKILNEAGTSLDDVVKATIFVTDINDFPKISPIRNKYFAKAKPASTLVEITNTVKPGCKVEIEVIAISGKKE